MRSPFRPFRSLRARVVALNTLMLAAMLMTLGATMPFLVRSAMLASVDRDLMDRAMRFLDHPPPGMPRLGGPRGPDQPGPPPGRGPDSGPEGPPPPPRAEETFAGGQGSPLRPRVILTQPGPNDKLPAAWDDKSAAEAVNRKTIYANVTVEGEPVRLISVPFPQSGEVQGVVQVPYALGDVNRAVTGLTATLLLLSPIALVLAAIGGFLLTGRALRPVQQITLAAERIGADALDRRLPTEGDDEFTLLASTFNAMLARLEEAFGTKEKLIIRLSELIDQQRRFTADASHELRTPLTAIKANASLSLSSETDVDELRQAVREIDASATTMARLVEDLLLLARSDAGQLARNPIEIAIQEPVAQAIARVRLPERAPIVLNAPDDPLTVRGDEDELTRLFANLLDNALRHTPADGSITVTISNGPDAALVEIVDTGSGISPEHLQHLGERFYRVDEARARAHGGTGLGLSICRSIVEAHGGAMEFESEIGKGTTVRVVLPLATDSAI